MCGKVLSLRILGVVMRSPRDGSIVLVRLSPPWAKSGGPIASLTSRQAGRLAGFCPAKG